MNSNGEKRRTYPNHKPNKEYKFTLRLYVMRRRGALSMNIEASVCSLYLLSTPSLLKVLSFNFDWQRHKISSVDWQSQKQTIQNTSDVISIVEVLHFTALVLIWSLARLGVTCWAPWLFTHQTFSRVLMFGHLTPHTSHLTPYTSHLHPLHLQISRSPAWLPSDRQHYRVSPALSPGGWLHWCRALRVLQLAFVLQ